MVSIDIGHAQEDAGEDDGVEDTHQGDAEHDPQRDEGDLPGPGDDAATQWMSDINIMDVRCQQNGCQMSTKWMSDVNKMDVRCQHKRCQMNARC